MFAKNSTKNVHISIKKNREGPPDHLNSLFGDKGSVFCRLPGARTIRILQREAVGNVSIWHFFTISATEYIPLSHSCSVKQLCSLNLKYLWISLDFIFLSQWIFNLLNQSQVCGILKLHPRMIILQFFKIPGCTTGKCTRD
jgi:hypothetical protein